MIRKIVSASNWAAPTVMKPPVSRSGTTDWVSGNRFNNSVAKDEVAGITYWGKRGKDWVLRDWVSSSYSSTRIDNTFERTIKDFVLGLPNWKRYNNFEDTYILS